MGPVTTAILGIKELHPDAADAALAARGDARAFERLYRAHAGRIRALACRLMGSDEADEAVQDRSNGILGVGTDLVTGFARGKDLLAGGGVLGLGRQWADARTRAGRTHPVWPD